MLAELVEVGEKLSEASNRFQQAGEARRKRIVEYFLNIEECLRGSAEQLRKDEVPTAKWGELKVYARKLSATIGKEIGGDTAEELSLLLLSTARNIPTKNDIQSLETCAGTFKGLANTVATKQSSNNGTRRKILNYTLVSATSLFGGLLLDKFNYKALPIDEPSKPSTETELFPFIEWEMHTFLSNSIQDTIIHKAPQMVCDLVNEMTNNRFKITLNNNGETEDILENVNNGTYKCGYSGIYYSESHKALYFACAIPFGLNPQEQNAWLDYKKNPDEPETYVQSIYGKVGFKNIISFPSGATGAQMGGWFKKEIKSVDELRGQKIRIPGLGGTVLQKFGVTLHSDLNKLGKEKLTLDDCIEKLKKGEFLAVEWTGPYDDIKLGLHKAADFYYYPGWWEPGTTFELQINREAWNHLPSHYRQILKVACFETHRNILNEYEQNNSRVLQNMPKNVHLVRFDETLCKTFREKTKELLQEYAEDPVFGEIYKEWNKFREQITWLDVNKIDKISRKWDKFTKS